MSESQFSLSWDKYQANMCAGFSSLQQTGEFVDLTLAADGHLVKVHQLIVGLASPFLKELIQSAACQHPVIFLNNVSYITLCSILEYIYTGEVSIAEDNLDTFFGTAKSLHIRGLERMLDYSDMEASVPEVAPVEPVQYTGKRIFKQGLQTVQIQYVKDGGKSTEQVELPVAARNIKVKRGLSGENSAGGTEPKRLSGVTPADEEVSGGEENAAGETAEDDQANSAQNFELTSLVEVSPATYTNTQELQYTVSNRGSLQLILNRYMYNLYSRSAGGRVRRWRCVDYRDHRCLACAITDGNVVTKRTNMHNHPFHDKRILAKIEKKAVYSAIRAVDGKGDVPPIQD